MQTPTHIHRFVLGEARGPGEQVCSAPTLLYIVFSLWSISLSPALLIPSVGSSPKSSIDFCLSPTFFKLAGNQEVTRRGERKSCKRCNSHRVIRWSVCIHHCRRLLSPLSSLLSPLSSLLSPLSSLLSPLSPLSSLLSPHLMGALPEHLTWMWTLCRLHLVDQRWNEEPWGGGGWVWY